MSQLKAGVGRSWPVVVLIALCCLLFPGTAHAGGPTSALLVSPATQQTAAVYYSDPEYDQLMGLLGDDPNSGTGAAAAAADQGADVSADYVTVTWLIHDVTIWRIDRIFLPAGPTGEPMIVTQLEDVDSGSAEDPAGSGMFPGGRGNDSAVWHRSSDPAALMGLLAEFGLLNSAETVLATEADVASAGETVANAGEGAAGNPGGPVQTAAASGVDPAARAVTGWWWAVGGLLVGAALMALALRYLPAARRRLRGEPAGSDLGQEPQQMIRIPG
jgi:hypothetical protein